MFGFAEATRSLRGSKYGTERVETPHVCLRIAGQSAAAFSQKKEMVTRLRFRNRFDASSRDAVTNADGRSIHK
jgi:hypothetical protein